MTALRNTPVTLIPDGRSVRDPCERAQTSCAPEAPGWIACFGDNRHTRTCQRLRDGRAPAEGLALSVVRQEGQGRLVGTVRLWHVKRWGHAGADGWGRWRSTRPAAASASARALMDTRWLSPRRRGHGAVILLGDAPYYARFGFSSLKTGELVRLPGQFRADRLLGLELAPRAALDRACGHDRADRRVVARAQGRADGRAQGISARKALQIVPHAA